MQNKLDQCLATDQSNIRGVLVLTTQTKLFLSVQSEVRKAVSCMECLMGLMGAECPASSLSVWQQNCFWDSSSLHTLTLMSAEFSHRCVCERDIDCYVFESVCLPAILSALGRTHSEKHHIIRNAIWMFIPLILLFYPKAFDVVEKSYFETIGDALAEKATIISQLPEVSMALCHS